MAMATWLQMMSAEELGALENDPLEDTAAEADGAVVSHTT